MSQVAYMNVKFTLELTNICCAQTNMKKYIIRNKKGICFFFFCYSALQSSIKE